MLRSLSVRDVVLIGRLDLTFRNGLCVLTGETGAGKSILLDALGLALGGRAEARLVRHGAGQASVTATFDLPPGAAVRALLSEHGLEAGEGELLVRRVLGADGRSRAFVNDQPVGVALLRQIGDALVEIHGQFESQRLLDPASHRGLLDAYAGLDDDVAATAALYRAWRVAGEGARRLESEVESARRDEDYLRHAVAEIVALAPEPGEETRLAERRATMMHAEKVLEAMRQASDEVSGGRGVEAAVANARRHLERVAGKAGGLLDAAIAALGRAASELAEAAAAIEQAAAALDLDAGALEKTEERLFALRALARKHATEVDSLAEVGRRLGERLAAVEDGGQALDRARLAEAQARTAYVGRAQALTKARRRAAVEFDRAVAAELEPLRLGGARFRTRFEALAEEAWAEHGADRVVFEVATNPGSPFGPLHRIASGGELARLMLALKVVLAGADPIPTIVFDEVDAGVGGAVAAAVGERLARLAEGVQVLVVTHSPQVAARGLHHWRVSKATVGPGVLTTVDVLSEAARREEIARMLAGESVTDEARAAAGRLLQGAQA